MSFRYPRQVGEDVVNQGVIFEFDRRPILVRAEEIFEGLGPGRRFLKSYLRPHAVTQCG